LKADLKMLGKLNAGQTIYTDRIDYRKHCIYHYHQTLGELATDCIDKGSVLFDDIP